MTGAKEQFNSSKKTGPTDRVSKFVSLCPRRKRTRREREREVAAGGRKALEIKKKTCLSIYVIVWAAGCVAALLRSP